MDREQHRHAIAREIAYDQIDPRATEMSFEAPT
ncbi:hypothetical protein QF002_008833 [Paraburkholderia youngii]